MKKWTAKIMKAFITVSSSFFFYMAVSSVQGTCFGPSYQPKVPTSLLR